LVFADDDGEDSEIYCSELAIWGQALSSEQAAELGGFGHNAGPFMMTRIPYLQAQGTNTMAVCWHDISQTGTKVQYGFDSTLSLVMTGTSELVSDPYRWHTVKLTGLQANTRYFYKVQSGGAESGMYSFKTLPDSSYTGKLRFVLLSDTHATDTTMAGKVLRAARDKITGLYGPDIENHINGIFHSGDVVVSGDIPGQYTKQYFKPLSALSPYIPTMGVAGNHEGESPYFYQYLKLDDQSAFPQITNLKEKVWRLRVGNSLFIGLNTNIIDSYGAAQANWLNAKLNETENDTTIDFVFLFFHHPPLSELWVVGGTDYVMNVLIPIVKKYTKVQMMHYGHTHGFERGTITSEKPGGDFRIICGGGGGGPNDPWREGENQDFNDIHKTLNHYFFQILEIDIANHSCLNSMYSLGNNNDPRNSELMDTWYKSKNQAGPGTPELENFEIVENQIHFNTSGFSGPDSLMSVQFQVIDSLQSSKIVLDSITHWTNIYNIDQYYKPVDVNKGINLLQSKIALSQLSAGKEYYFRVRYRDHNLKWSEWSALTSFSSVGTDENPGVQQGYYLEQNIPNPFRNQTKFTYIVPEKCEVIFRVYDKNMRIIMEINEGVKLKGTYTLDFNAENLASDVYIYEMNANNLSVSKKMIHIK
jgi:acid phosphatase type 7